MTDYIRREEILDTLDECIDKCEKMLPITPAQVHEVQGEINAAKAIRVFVKHLPAADVWEVVTCGECKHWFEFPGQDYCSCDRDALLRQRDFWCAAGERKTNCGVEMEGDNGSD